MHRQGQAHRWVWGQGLLLEVVAAVCLLEGCSSATVFGATGCVGHYIVNALARAGTQVGLRAPGGCDDVGTVS
jgi:hypothetical protein